MLSIIVKCRYLKIIDDIIMVKLYEIVSFKKEIKFRVYGSIINKLRSTRVALPIFTYCYYYYELLLKERA